MRGELAALAGFGRWKLLGALSGEDADFTTWYDRLTYWHGPLMAGPPATDRAVQELNQAATDYGGWVAVGAWKTVMEFGSDEPKQDAAPALAACVRAYDGFGITNLALHLPMVEARAFSNQFERPPPMDGFSGPPVFTTNEGPQKVDLLASAAEHARNRSPARLVHAPRVAPQGLESLRLDRLFDFGRLLYMGPDMVGAEASYEPALLLPYRRASDGADHSQVAALLRSSCESALDEYNGHPGWAAVGAARFVEDYLDASFTGSRDHLALLDLGLDFIVDARVLDGNCLPESLSPAEQLRLKERGGTH